MDKLDIAWQCLSSDGAVGIIIFCLILACVIIWLLFKYAIIPLWHKLPSISYDNRQKMDQFSEKWMLKPIAYITVTVLALVVLFGIGKLIWMMVLGLYEGVGCYLDAR